MSPVVSNALETTENDDKERSGERKRRRSNNRPSKLESLRGNELRSFHDWTEIIEYREKKQGRIWVIAFVFIRLFCFRFGVRMISERPHKLPLPQPNPFAEFGQDGYLLKA